MYNLNYSEMVFNAVIKVFGIIKYLIIIFSTIMVLKHVKIYLGNTTFTGTL